MLLARQPLARAKHLRVPSRRSRCPWCGVPPAFNSANQASIGFSLNTLLRGRRRVQCVDGTGFLLWLPMRQRRAGRIRSIGGAHLDVRAGGVFEWFEFAVARVPRWHVASGALRDPALPCRPPGIGLGRRGARGSRWRSKAAAFAARCAIQPRPIRRAQQCAIAGIAKNSPAAPLPYWFERPDARETDAGGNRRRGRR